MRSCPCAHATAASTASFSRAICRYYTVGLNELAEMESSYTFGLKWTPHTKIKVDDDTARLEGIFAALSKLKPADSLAMCSLRISSAAFKLQPDQLFFFPGGP